MNIRTKLFSLLTLGAFSLTNAQISEGGLPYSSSLEVDFNLKPITVDYPQDLLTERSMNDGKDGSTFSIAHYLPVGKTISNAGQWHDLENGDRIWTLTLSSPEALGLGVTYDDFYLPSGAKLFLYNKSKTQIIGGYTSANNPSNGIFANELIEGDQVTLELYEPQSARGLSRISVQDVAHAYREVNFLQKYSEREFGDADYCLVNVNCPEGDNWQDEKRGVSRILVRAGSSAGWCSGSLINNTAQDCTPYYLTANHCAEGASESDLNQWTFYFNYEAPGCADPSTQGSLASQTIIGCAKKSSGSTSDFYLVELNTSPPSAWDPYYNGWDRSSGASSSGTSIHHPSGDIKKISTYNNSLSSSTWSGVSGTHWRVVWSNTTTAHSVTEGGSSGSPIFNSTGNIVGQLHGGASYCNATNASDLYGKIYYSWDPSGSSASGELKTWLDPTNSGVSSLNGTNVPCSSQAMNDGGVLDIGAPAEDAVVCGTVFTPWINLQNNGFNDLTEAEITYTVDGTEYTYSYTGQIATGASLPVYFPDVTISSTGDYSMVVNITSVNGGADDDSSNNSLQTNFSVNTTGEKIKIRIKKDLNGSEVTWELKDDQNTVIATGGPYNDNNMAWETEYVCVDEGCFTFTISDSGGDGICCSSGSGRYEIQSPDGSVILGMGNGEYTNEEVKTFCWLTGVDDVNANDKFSVYPVPASNYVLFDYSLESVNKVSIKIVDALGRVVSSNMYNGASLTQEKVGIENLSNGLYHVVLESDNGRMIRQLQIVK